MPNRYGTTAEEIETNKAVEDARRLEVYTPLYDAWLAAIERQNRLLTAGNFVLAVQVDIPERPIYKKVPG